MPKQKWRRAVFLKADCTKELSPEMYVSVKEWGTSSSLLAPSLSLSLSLSQIRLAFTKMLLYYIVFHFWTGILRLSSDFNTLSALISMS